MALAAFTFTDRARPVIELGIGDVRAGGGLAQWDVAHWDTDAARWGGDEPSWLDVSCDTQLVRLEYGRQRTTDRFVVGVATVVVANATGWADPNAVDVPGVLTVRPGRPLRVSVDHTVFGRRVLFRGFVDAMTPSYLPTVGDTVDLSCIDALGEVNRAKLAPVDPPVGDGETVSARIDRILTSAIWPDGKRNIAVSTESLVASDMGGQVADLLGVAADSAGGNIFGDTEGRITFRGRDWQMFAPDVPADGTIGNVDPAVWVPGTPAVPGYLTPTIGVVTTPDPGSLPTQCTFVFKVRGPSNAFGVVCGQWLGAPNLSWEVALAPADNVLYFITSADGTTPTYAYTSTADPTGADQYRAVSVDRGQPIVEWSSPGDGTWQQVGTAFGANVTPHDVDVVVHIGNAFAGRIYSVECRTGLTPSGGAVLWRFDASEYPGAGTTYTDPRGRTWTLAAAGAIVPAVPAVPGHWQGDACPTGWERPYARADMATRAIMGRDLATAVVLDDPEGIARFGIEPFERVDLLTQRDQSLHVLAERVLRVRATATAPRVRSVALDARTADNVLDLMSTVDVYRPSRYRCRLRYPDPRGLVFDDDYLATGVVHELAPDHWSLNLNLDLAAPFAAAGGRWDGAYWDLAAWAQAS